MSKRYTSRRDLAELFLNQNGKCACGLKLEKGNYIIEHSTPLALGGLDVLANKYLNCKECAHKKTYGHSKATCLNSDRHNIDKTKRLRGETCNGPTKKIPSRGFQKPPEGYKYKWGKQSFGRAKP